MNEIYQPGANWISRDGKRNVVIVSDELGYRGPAFLIRNLETGRESRIEVTGCTESSGSTASIPPSRKLRTRRKDWLSDRHAQHAIWCHIRPLVTPPVGYAQANKRYVIPAIP